ncbi:hypothetical protein VA7868_04582 [Vibrio aerogenes CECT 7868]|uniref:Uncharacterized protein n=1 Tax=Vibrio aerogenes CECT 7868 TaxID=1216006 RepID=A0A1M6F573_9VIBR|nr:hypothetical protein VA7868_04582 [Vibrio aerogenes CECT 7868]
MFTGDFLVECFIDTDGAVFGDFDPLLALNHQMIGFFDIAEVVIFDCLVAVVFNVGGRVVFDQGFDIFLRVQVDFFAAGLVFKTQLVVAFALMRLGAQHGFGFIGWQGIRRGVAGIIRPAGDNRLIRVAMKKTDDDFIADARHGHHALLAASPAL